MSVAVGHRQTTGIGTVARTVIRTLRACDTRTGREVQIQPGARVAACRIRRDSVPGEVYVMEFETTSRRYYCPLANFLPRTEAVQQAGVEEQPARDSVAV